MDEWPSIGLFAPGDGIGLRRRRHPRRAEPYPVS